MGRLRKELTSPYLELGLFFGFNGEIRSTLEHKDSIFIRTTPTNNGRGVLRNETAYFYELELKK